MGDEIKQGIREYTNDLSAPLKRMKAAYYESVNANCY